MRRRILTVFLCICVMFSVSSISFAVTPAEEYTNEADVISEIIDSVPPDSFGGVFYNDEGQLVLSIKEGTSINPASAMCSTQPEVVLQSVRYSLSELEAMKEMLEPYMATYGIATLDANEVTNTIDIELWHEHLDIYPLLNSLPLIDVNIVSVTVLDDEFRAAFTYANQPASTVPEEYTELFGRTDLPAAVSTTITIYPGTNIAIDNTSFGLGEIYYGTAGPRYSSSMFLSATSTYSYYSPIEGY